MFLHLFVCPQGGPPGQHQLPSLAAPYPPLWTAMPMLSILRVCEKLDYHDLILNLILVLLEVPLALEEDPRQHKLREDRPTDGTQME